MRIRFANWQPDLQGLTNPGQGDIRNVIPVGGGGYAPVRDLSALSTTGLAAQAKGAVSATDDGTGATNTFAGDAASLYLLEGAAFTDISKMGGYSVDGAEHWEFAQFGQRIIATQISDAVQFFDLGGAAFADLAGSPPQARHIAIVRDDFVFLGNTTNSANEVFWSGFNNSESWSKGTNQCDSQTLPGNGWVQRIIGGEVGYVYQERAITRVTYVGPPVIFQFDLVEQARGLAASGAIAVLGQTHFFLSQDGFYSFDSVNGSQGIGSGKVDDWFFTHLEPGTETLITASASPTDKLIFWSFVSTDATDATKPDTLLIYNWQTKEWTYGKVAHELIVQALTTGFTLEQLSSAYPVLEDVPSSLDSRVWTGGAAYLAAFDPAHQLSSFSGDTLPALLETSDQEFVQGKRAIVTNIRPFCDTANCTAIVRSRERFADMVVDTTTGSMQPNGDIPLIASGRYQRVQLDIPAGEDWTYATGMDVEASDDGEI